MKSRVLPQALGVAASCLAYLWAIWTNPPDTFLPWLFDVLLAVVFVGWQATHPYRLGAALAQSRDGLFRAFGWLASLAAAYQTHPAAHGALAEVWFGTALESASAPAASFASLGLGLGLGVALHRLPGWLDGERLAGRLATAPARETLALGAAWMPLSLLLAGYAVLDDDAPVLPGGQPFSPHAAARWLLAGLAATAAYGLPRIALDFIAHRPGKTPVQTPPTMWLVFDRPVRRKTDGRLIDRLASARKGAPLVLAAHAGGDLLGEHLRLADRQGRLQALFPRLEIELGDWQRLLPPKERWQSLACREIYSAPSLLPTAVQSLRGPEDRVLLVNGDGIHRWRSLLPDGTTAVLAFDGVSTQPLESISGYETIQINNKATPQSANLPRPRLHWNLRWVLGASMATILVVAMRPILDTPPLPPPAMFEVHASDAWQTSGVQVKNGEFVKITYIKGVWRTQNNVPFTNPLGLATLRPEEDIVQDPECHFPIPVSISGINALIAKIGDGQAFNPFKTTKEGEGMLYLRLNDCDKYLGDNAGSVTVNIRVGLEADITMAGGDHFYEAPVRSDAGEHLISVTVPQQALHVLAVGVSNYQDADLRLQYPANDARAVAEAFAAGGKPLFPRGVRLTVLADQQASLNNILQSFDAMAKGFQPQDTFVLFLAGHGQTSQDGQYYFLPWEMRYENDASLARQALGEDKLREMLRRAPLQTVVLLDTAQAGTRGVEQKVAIIRLMANTGRVVIAASAPADMALEGSGNHSVFTYALLQALSDADYNGDGIISVDELDRKVSDLVPKLSAERFHYKSYPLSELPGNAHFPLVTVRH
jgi:hypothetical protein